MLLKDDDSSPEIYTKFFRNGVRWLVNREEEKRVRIYTGKGSYNSGEEVIFNANIYDNDYKPADNAEVKVVIQKGDLTIEKNLTNKTGGIYKGEIKIIEPGNYKYRGEAYRFDRKIGEDSGEFSVGTFSIEMLETRTRNDILQNIAKVSGGKHYTIEDVQNLFNDLADKNKNIIKTSNTEIYNKSAFMILIVILLSLEWFLRKRFGML